MLFHRHLARSQQGDNSLSIRHLAGPEGARMLEAGTQVIVGDHESFELISKSAQVGVYSIRKFTATPFNYFHSPDDVSEFRIRYNFVLEGTVAYRQRGRITRVTAGETVVVCEREPYAMLFSERTRMLTVACPETAPFFETVLPGGDAERQGRSLSSTRIRRLPASSLTATASRAFFQALLRPQVFPLLPVEQVRVTRAIDATLFALLAEAGGLNGGDSTPSAEERSIIRAFIASNFSIPGLSTSEVAAHYGMSVRSLQRLFSGSGESVSGMIQHRRLEHAVAMLHDERCDELSVEEVAQRSGFTSADQLRRVMAREMNATPSGTRANR
ncbi:AraC family transcriptional regulator [Lysinibacter sp. HNR]|uniref:helix-turn-helix domain-containing protein n=1 Tax=Lysinibacter sp. HNR TaxID=3031408 RepID=UPI00243485D5|nr:AraC family transcriptional regulator [Lysinibacter sp. HNR]WGD37030.1 AraC family transcriptional regulator [Lysinibacter sp. HNR]